MPPPPAPGATATSAWQCVAAKPLLQTTQQWHPNHWHLAQRRQPESNMAMTDTNPETTSPAGPSAFRRAVRVGLYVLFLIAACLAAYQARLLVLSHRSPPGPAMVPGAHRAQPPDTSQPWDLQSPRQAAGAPLAEAGLRPFDKDSGGIAPPPGATAAMGFEQQSEGMTLQQRIYECPGTLETVKSYYAAALARGGFAPVQEKPLPDGSLTMLLAKGTTQVNLALRKTPGQAKMVRVVLIVSTE